MTGNWDSYFCHVDGKPASILLNLDFYRTAPLPEYPVFAYVSFNVHEPDEDGFPQQEEYEAFAALEDTLIAGVRGRGALYVGRCATDGHFDMFFYLRTQAGWAELLHEQLDGKDEYEWEAGAQEDSDWTSYLDFLFPDPYALRAMQNRRAVEQLLERGDDPSESRMIEHWAGFPTLEAAQQFAENLRSDDFSVSEPECLPEQDEDAPISPAERFMLSFSRPDIPEEMDELTFALADMAEAGGGVYHGWGVA